MATQRAVARAAQYTADASEKRLRKEVHCKFLGRARVSLAQLDFTYASSRKLDIVNVQRLQTAFELTGCVQINDHNHVPAIIDDQEFTELVRESGFSSEQCKSRNPKEWPFLRPEKQVLCLHGRHRIAAAQNHLTGDAQWWVIAFFSNSISVSLRTALTEQTHNEARLTSGELFFHILRCDPKDDEAINAWLARVKSANSRREIQELLHRPSLVPSFRKLSRFTVFARSMRVGNITKMLRLKCNEEVRCYLEHIYTTFTYLFADDPSSIELLDCESIKHIESRCPQLCQDDFDYLQPLFEDGKIFTAYDQEQRQEVWRKLMTLDRLVPTLHTFFEDLKYLRCLARCVKRVIRPTRRQTLRQALYSSFSGTEPFHNRYQMLWLTAMQLMEDIEPGSLRVEHETGLLARVQSPNAIHDFAQKASGLGFMSIEIQELLKIHPDRIEAKEALLRARKPQLYEYPAAEFEQYINQIVGLFDKAKAIGGPDSSFEMLSSTHNEILKRRRGRPFRIADAECSPQLSLENIQSAKIEPAQRGGLTAFFVRRDVFLSFFMQKDRDCISATALLPRQQLSTITEPNATGHSPEMNFSPGPLVRYRSALQLTPLPQVQGSVASASEYTDVLMTSDGYADEQEDQLYMQFVDENRNVLRAIQLYTASTLDQITEAAQEFGRNSVLVHPKTKRAVHVAQCYAIATQAPFEICVVLHPNRRRHEDMRNRHQSRTNSLLPTNGTHRRHARIRPST